MFGKYFGILLAEGLCVEGVTCVLVYCAEGIGKVVKRQGASDSSGVSTSV